MRHETLIRTSLRAIHSKSEGIDENRSRFANAALGRLDELTSAVENSENVHDLADTLLQVNDTPENLPQSDREAYALFIHDLFKEGECHGMAHEDPLAASVLMTGALHVLKRSIVNQEKYALLPMAVDLMLLGTVAQLIGGSREIAKIQLITLLQMALDKGISKEFGKQAPDALKDVLQARVLPGIILMAEVFDSDDEEDQQYAVTATVFAQSLLKKLIKDRPRYPGTSAEYVKSILALADLYMNAEAKEHAFDMIYRAIDVIEEDLKCSSFSSAYCFVASTTYQKRSEMAIMEDELKEAAEFLQIALEFVQQAVLSCPTNTHYEDHRAELLNQMGIVHGMRGNIPDAQEALLAAVDCRRVMAEKSEQYKVGLVSALNNMSTLLSRFGNFPAAKLYMEECLEVMDSIDPVDRSPGYKAMLRALTRAQEALTEAAHPKTNSWSKNNDPNRFGAN